MRTESELLVAAAKALAQLCTCTTFHVCDPCRIRRDIADHLASQPDADTLRRWYPTLDIDLSRSGGAL